MNDNRLAAQLFFLTVVVAISAFVTNTFLFEILEKVSK